MKLTRLPFIVAFGLTLITSLLIPQMNLLRLGGGMFLGYLGVKTFLAPETAFFRSDNRCSAVIFAAEISF